VLDFEVLSMYERIHESDICVVIFIGALGGFRMTLVAGIRDLGAVKVVA
jgi:hypothetical protein